MKTILILNKFNRENDMKTLIILVACFFVAPAMAVQYQVAVKGMDCQMCASSITKELNNTKKAQKVNISIEKGSATFESVGQATLTDDEIKGAIKRAGFDVTGIQRR